MTIDIPEKLLGLVMLTLKSHAASRSVLLEERHLLKGLMSVHITVG
jgi:hypothetical protein